MNPPSAQLDLESLNAFAQRESVKDRKVRPLEAE